MEFVVIGGQTVEVPPDIIEKGRDAAQAWHDEQDEANALEDLRVAGLQLWDVTATGAGGRLTRRDVFEAVKARASAAPADDPPADDEG